MPSILALDVGTRTIGVARAHAHGPALATPLLVLSRQGVRKDVARLLVLCQEQQAATVVVGLPYDLAGDEGRSARLARQVGEALAEASGLPVHYQDERFTTVEASARLRAAGHDSRDQRAVIDAAAAAVILQDWLDASRGAAR
jgi:putative Holliday junction resolvase